MLHTSVVDQNIYLVSVRFQRVYRRAHSLMICHVKSRCQNGATLLLELLCSLIEFCAVSAIENEPCTGIRQALRQCKPDSLRRTGNKRGLTRQTE